MLKTNEIAELFGFDLGDGESAVAWMRFDSPVPPQLLEVSGRKNFLSALGEHPTLGTLIGEQALLVDSERLSLRFKGSFLTDAAASSQIEAFARATLMKLRESGKAENLDACAFFVGCPSGWPEQARTRYRKIFERAGYPNVEIISESRAAFMFVRESGELGAGKSALDRPTLIVDAGSSTTDFTFVDRLEARPIDFGENLGGGLIDQFVLDQNLKQSPNETLIRDIFEKCPPYRARCELEARKLKEQYFSRKITGAQFPVPCESSVKLYYTDPPVTLDLAIGDRDMDEVLHAPSPLLSGRSFVETMLSGFERARSMLRATPPEVILLTGGASRMGFIASLAKEIFPDALLLRGAEPEFAIARGLCYALNVDIKTLNFRAEVEALLSSGEIARVVTEALPDFYRMAAPIIVGALVDDCAPDALRRWKRGDIETIDQMGEEIAALVEQSLQGGDARKALERAAADWVPSLRTALEALTDPICARYSLSAASLRIPGEFFLDPQKLDLGTKAGMMDLNFAQTAIDLTVASLIAALLGGGGVALMMAGPVGLVISFIIGFVVSRLGTSLARTRILRINLPRILRAAYSERSYRASLERKRDELTSSVIDQLNMELRASGESSRAAIEKLSDAIARQLNALADQARLLLR